MSEEQATDPRYATSVGARLRAVRRQRGLSLLAVQDMSQSEFRASALGAYERGDRVISVPRLERLAALYGVPVDQLLPAGASSVSARQGRPARRSKVTVDVDRLRGAQGPAADALRRFLESVKVERQDFNGRVMTIRGDDVRVIGAALGLEVDEMLARLSDLGVLAPRG